MTTSHPNPDFCHNIQQALNNLYDCQGITSFRDILLNDNLDLDNEHVRARVESELERQVVTDADLRRVVCRLLSVAD